MASLCQATVIVEATDKSGTLHQARACLRLGLPLFIGASQANNPAVQWPAQFAGPHTHVLTHTQQVLELLNRRAA